MFFRGTLLLNKEKRVRDERLAQVIQQPTAEDLLPQIRAKIPYKLFVCKDLQENYDFYRLIRSKLSA